MDKKELESVLKGAMEETVEVLGKKQADAIAAVKDEVNKKLEDINKTVNEKNINTDKTTIEVKEPEPEFVKDAGQFFTMVAKAANDVKVKVDFAEALEKNWKIKAPSGSNTLVSSEGGFLLTPQIAAEIKSAMYETGQLYKAADIMPLGGSNDRYVWVEAVNEDRSTAGSYNGIVAYRVNEGVAATTSKPQFRERELAVKDMMVRVPVTRQLLGDAVALQRMIMNDAPKAMNKKVDREIIQGTGSGQCLGIINASSTVSVAKENLQPADTIVKENIDKMFDIFDPDYLTGAAWHVNPFARKELRNLVMAVGTGGAPVYLPEGGMSGTPYATLLGLPVIPTNACPKLGDKGDIILANMNEYLMVEKGGIEAAESMHVLFNTNEHMFRFTWRINGMPKLAQQITPENANAGDRLSSFVTLDARA